MNTKVAAWVGADPGGKGGFGIAILHPDGSAQFDTVDCADEAVAFVRQRLSSPPAGVGVDAPLWWSSGPSSDRHADQWLRSKYRFSGGQVQTANSLWGAALVQAAMFLQRLRECYPNVPVTEAHPKALFKVLAEKQWKTFANRFAVAVARVDEEDERDAIIAAVAAREGFEGRWTRDLSIDRFESEQNPETYWLAPVHYFWPPD